MAKKKAARGEFNMSEEIRKLLSENPNQSSREVFEGLQANFPEQTINRNSCNVAFSHARRKLGLQKGAKKVVRRLKPGATSAPAAVAGGHFNLGALQAAKDLLNYTGSAALAIQAIQQLESLQLN